MIDSIFRNIIQLQDFERFISLLKIGLLLAVLTLLVDIYSPKVRNVIRKYLEGRISKIIKAYATRLLSVLWFAFLLFAVHNILNSAKLERLLISSFLFCLLLLLNCSNNLLFKLFVSFLEVLAKIYSVFVPRKPYTQRAKYFFALPLKDLLLIALILLSFSFDFILSDQNYVAIGIALIVFIGLYLVKSLIDLFLMQRDLLLITDTLEVFENAVISWKEKGSFQFVKLTIPFIVGFIHRNIISKNELQQKIDSLKKKVQKARFFSRYGLSFFKLALTFKLFAILFSTLIFVLLTQSNYYLTLNGLGVIRAEGFSFPHYLLNSFYMFIGENVSNITYLQNVSYFQINTLAVAFIGWFLVVAFVIMFIDIITISVDEFSKTINKVVESLIPDTLNLLDFLKDSEGIDFHKKPLENIVKKYNKDSTISQKYLDSLFDRFEELEEKIKSIKSK